VTFTGGEERSASERAGQLMMTHQREQLHPKVQDSGAIERQMYVLARLGDLQTPSLPFPSHLVCKHMATLSRAAL
jgi:hypothetical protein